ncbi:hypothetical protein ACFXBB_39855, partial [Streptomyces scopuliridis]
MSPTRNEPQVLVQIDDCLARVAAERGGALWRLAEAGRQLDADVVRLGRVSKVAPSARRAGPAPAAAAAKCRCGACDRKAEDRSRTGRT